MGVIIWIAIAMLAGVVGWLFADDWKFLTRARRLATGTVIDHQREAGEDGGEFFKAKVAFRADNGREYVFVDLVGLPKPSRAIGTPVVVAYPAGFPEKARLHRWWLRPVLYAFVVGVILVLLAKRFGYLS